MLAVKRNDLTFRVTLSTKMKRNIKKTSKEITASNASSFFQLRNLESLR